MKISDWKWYEIIAIYSKLYGKIWQENYLNVKLNISIAISEFEGFCKRREEENYDKNILERENVKILYYKLQEIKNNKKLS